MIDFFPFLSGVIKMNREREREREGSISSTSTSFHLTSPHINHNISHMIGRGGGSVVREFELHNLF